MLVLALIVIAVTGWFTALVYRDDAKFWRKMYDEQCSETDRIFKRYMNTLHSFLYEQH